MVAITVAIAATVYVYVSGMIGGGTQKTPTISCVPNNTDNNLGITSADPDIAWADINITVNCNGTADTHYITSMTGSVTAGQSINVEWLIPDSGNKAAITLRYNPTNTLIGTWTVS